jgi:hypothetical protein
MVTLGILPIRKKSPLSPWGSSLSGENHHGHHGDLPYQGKITMGSYPITKKSPWSPRGSSPIKEKITMVRMGILPYLGKITMVTMGILPIREKSPWLPWKSALITEKFTMVEPGIEPGTS